MFAIWTVARIAIVEFAISQWLIAVALIVLCLGAAITIAVGGVINIINQSALENAAEESLAAAEANLLGRFGALRPSPGNP